MTRKSNPQNSDPSPSLPEMEVDRKGYGQGLPPKTAEALFDRIAHETVDRSPTLSDGLREASTRKRVAGGAILSLGIAALGIWGSGLRSDVAELGQVPYVSALSTAILLVLLSVGLSLRGPHRSSKPSRVRFGLGLALMAPLLLLVIPEAWPGHPLAEALPPWTQGCFWMGVCIATTVTTLLTRLDRYDPPLLSHSLAASATAALAAFITQQFHCPFNDTWHLVTAHALDGALVAVVVVILHRWTAPRRRLR